MPVERFYASEEFAVVAAGNENLSVRTNGGLEDGEGSGGELVLFELRDFVFAGRCLSEW